MTCFYKWVKIKCKKNNIIIERVYAIMFWFTKWKNFSLLLYYDVQRLWIILIYYKRTFKEIY